MSLLALLLTAAAPAGVVTFEPPSGWVRTESAGEVDFTPPGVPRGGFCTLAFLPSQETSNFPSWFATAWSGFKAGHAGVQETQPQASNTADHQLALIAGSMQAGGNRFLYVVFFAAYRDGRVQPVLFTTDDNGLYQRFQPVVQAVVGGLRFLPRSAWPAAGPAAPLRLHDERPAAQTPVGRPNPVAAPTSDLLSPSFTWPEVAHSSGPGLNGVFGKFDFGSSYYRAVTTQWMYVTLLPDGSAYKGIASEGLENFNPSYWAQENAMRVGTYALSGRKGRIEWGGGGGSESFDVDGNKLHFGGGKPFERLTSCDGLALDGTYRREDWQKQQELPMFRNVHATFRRDGTFEEEGLAQSASVMWWRPGKGDLMEKVVLGAGTYAVGHYSLTLVYQDGRKRRMNITVPPGSPGDGSIFMINGWKFVRVR